MRGMRAARLQALKADIEASITDGQLSVVHVASRHQVTPRYVQILFESEGTTFSNYVIVQRLTRAHRMLTDAGLKDWSISAIARAVGFANLSYFNRTFRKRYGVTPSEVRQGMRNGK